MSLRHINAVAAFAVQGAAVALIACTAGRDASPRVERNAAAANRRAAVDPDVEATCAAVARFWRRAEDSAVVRVADSLVTPQMFDSAVTACVVVADQEHSGRRRASGAVDTVATRLGSQLTLARGTGTGWISLPRYMADGPDGSIAAYQRGRVRCVVDQAWDGGDDADSTYVAADWFKEQTTCWLMASGITVADTAGR